MNTPAAVVQLIDKAIRSGQKLDKKDLLAILTACKDLSYSPELIEQLRQLIIGHASAAKQLDMLSDREQQIFHFIGLGYSSRQIANTLGITEATVSTHRKNMIRKLKISGTGQLQKTALAWVYELNP
ncbi:MAG: LuxR C-terminal-related transcriptional regulator [Dokdonia sp.]|jgi:DNA-binding NarL/FixJ family response regulator|nr:hypothetical protein [Cytophagaceae bacterium]